MSKRLPIEIKIRLIKRARAGESISKICQQYQISRTIFYRWLNAYETAPSKRKKRSLSPKHRRGSTHWRALSKTTLRQIYKLAIKHPAYTPKRISEIVSVSPSAIWKFLRKLDLNTRDKRQTFQEVHGSSLVKEPLVTDKVTILRRYEAGEKVSTLCQEFGISRTTFYKWQERHRTQKRTEALLSRRPHGDSHWRFVPGNQKKVLAIVYEHPEFTPLKISQALFNKVGKKVLGAHGVYNILKRLDLNSVSRRLNFVKAQKAPVKLLHPIPDLDREKSVWQKFTPQVAPAPPPLVAEALVKATKPYDQLLPAISPEPPPISRQLVLKYLLSSCKHLIISLFRLPLTQRKPLKAAVIAFAITLSGVSFLVGTIYYILIFFSAPSLSVAIGYMFASVALAFGMFFFLYSFKYYASVVLVLLFSRQIPHEFTAESVQPSDHNSPNSPSYLKVRGLGGVTSSGLIPDISSVTLDRHPFVSIHLPLYNEKRVVNRLLEAVTSMDYDNFEVIVADDSTDETKDMVMEWKNHPRIKISHRDSRQGFKGGALREALKLMDKRTEFVLVFDSDFLPYPDTITQFLKYFQATAGTLEFSPQSSVLNFQTNPTPPPLSQRGGEGGVASSQLTTDNLQPTTNCPIAAIQGYQWHVLNKSENWITRGVRSEYAGSYVVERSSAEIYQGLKQIAGSVYMIRADVLKAYGWGDSITEDFELTLKLYADGYKVVYTPYIQAPSECVSTLKRLVRQRMRWAEGHSHNIKRLFWNILLSNKTEKSEKFEFLYLSPYYLQSFFFLIGTFCWFIAEAVFQTRLPFWTQVWGWSLVLTNMLSLPLMNLVGMFLEEAEEKDYLGIFSFMLLTYIVAPFQAYASVKGFLEKEEGPWFRTPKTGHITDVFKRGRFYRWLSGIFPSREPSLARSHLAKLIAFSPDRLVYNDSGSLGSGSIGLATANNHFNSFNIKRSKGRRYVGRLLISVLLVVSATLLLNAAYIETAHDISIPSPGSGSILSPKDKQTHAPNIMSNFSLVKEAHAAADSMQNVFVSGVRQVSLETLVASSGIVLLLTLALLIYLFRKNKRLFKKAIKSTLVFSLILSWLFSGWPRLPFTNFPPKIKEVSAGVPSFVSAGSVDTDVNGACAITPGPPTHVANDIIIVAAYNSNGDAMSTATSGWTSFNNIAGTDDIAFFWKRATGAGTAGPAITAAGTDCFGIAYIIRGTVTTGDPFEDATNSGDGTTQDDTPDTALITTTGANRLAMAFVAHDGESAGVTWSSGNPPATWTADSNVDSSAGTDAGFYVISKTQASAGDVSSVVVGTWSAATLFGAVTLAFIPDPLAFDQTAFRVRSDDGTALNTNSGWAEAVNTDASIGPDLEFRIRFEVEASATATQGFELWYSRNSAAYAIVPNNNGPTNIHNRSAADDGQKTAQVIVSNQYADEASATELLTGAGTSSTTFITGSGNEDNTTPSVSFSGNSHTELEFAVLIRKLYDSKGHNPDGTTFDFRLYKSGGTALDTYTNDPRVTVLNRPGHIGGTVIETPLKHHVVDGNGNLYYLEEYADTSNSPVMMKSTNGGNSWTPQDTADEPTGTDLEAGDFDLRGDTIYMALQGPGTVDSVEFWQYNVSTHGTPDQWQAAEAVETVSTGVTNQNASIVKRSGSTVIFYRDVPVGADDQINYKIKTDGGSWGSENILETTTGEDVLCVSAVRDSSDKIHIAYVIFDTTIKLYVKSLSTGDVLSGRTLVVNTSITTAAGNRCDLTPLINWTDTATERVGVGYRKSDNNMYFASWPASDITSITADQLISGNTVDNQGGGSDLGVMGDVRYDDATDNLHAIYLQRTVFDIWSDSRVSGSWGTDVERQDNVQATWIRSLVFTHSAGNGGAKVVGYVWDQSDQDLAPTQPGGTGFTEYDEYDIGDSTAAIATGYSFQRKTFYDESNSRYWKFFHDGDEIDIRYSANDGDSWTTITSLAYDTNDFSIWWKAIGTTEYVWLAVATVDDIVVRRGELSTTDITWHATSQVALNGTGATDTYANAYVSLDSSNFVWVLARYFNGTNYVVNVVDSAAAGDSNWATLTWNTKSQLTDNQTNANVYGAIVPLSLQDMYATFVTNTALEGCFWDDSDVAWESSAGLSCTAGNQDAIDTEVTGLTKNISAVADGTNFDVHLIFIDDAATDQVSYKRWDSGTLTWDSTATLVADAADNNDAYPSLSYNTTGTTLYALWIDTSASDIFYSSCDISTECNLASEWGAETNWKSAGTNTYVTSNYDGAGRIFAEWTIGSASPFSIGWDTIIVPENLWLFFALAPLLPLLLRKKRKKHLALDNFRG